MATEQANKMSTMWDIIPEEWRPLAMILIAVFGFMSRFIKFKAIFMFLKNMLNIRIGKDKNTRQFQIEIQELLLENILEKQEKENLKIVSIRRRTLSNQMIATDQSIATDIFLLKQSFAVTALEKNKTLDEPLDIERVKEQHLLYSELVINAFRRVSHEMRRMFKENGFHDLTGNEWEDYKKTKFENLEIINRNYIYEKYPDSMIIPLQDRLNYIDRHINADAYIRFSQSMNKARDIYVKGLSAIKMVKEEFKLEIKRMESKTLELHSNNIDDDKSKKLDLT